MVDAQSRIGMDLGALDLAVGSPVNSEPSDLWAIICMYRHTCL